MTRRDLLSMGTVAGAAAVGMGSASLALAPAKAAEMAFPWPHQRLRPKKIADRAYTIFHTEGGCCIGAFKSIMLSLAEKLGGDYLDFPFDFSQFGAGGVALYGTLCGTLNGAAMAIAMIVPRPQYMAIIKELFTWYEKTNLPTYIPKARMKPGVKLKLARSKAESTICHISVSRWVKKSGFSAWSPQRSERCGSLAASVAEKAVELINDWAKGKFVLRNEMSKVAEGCLACHNTEGERLADEPDVISTMNCEPCHDAEQDRTIPHF